MRDGWETVRLGDLLTGGTGLTYGIVQPGQHVPNGIPVVRVADILGNRVSDGEPLRVAGEVAERHTRTKLGGGELLLSVVGTVGRVALVDRAFAGWNVARAVAVLRPQRSGQTEWLYYALQAPSVQHAMGVLANDTVQITLNLRDVAELELWMPPLDEQRRIAGVLGALDDLIETNERLADGSEALACAISSSSERQVELREIASSPKLRSEMPDGFVDHFSLPAFDAGRRPDAVAGADIKSNKLQIVSPTVIVSRLNPQTPRVWMVYPGSRKAYASTEFVPIAPQDGIAVEEVWPLCAAEGFSAQLRQHITGTTGSHQRVDKKILLDLVVPDPRGIRASDRTAVINLVREAHGSRSGAAQLRRTRDELLPLLMSGAVSPGEVDVVS